MEKERLVFLDEKEVENMIEDFVMGAIPDKKPMGIIDFYNCKKGIAKLICSHFSKQIKYPEKKDVIFGALEKYTDWLQYKNAGFNECIETMRKLNGEE